MDTVARVLLFGLGNPGGEYENTRHNLGFRVIDRLCQRLHRTFVPEKSNELIAWAMVGGTQVGLIKPLTYMNNSGEAVADAIRQFRVSPSEILVVCDDFAIPLGMLRLRASGSDGGHNGLASIIYHLQSAVFPRLRCGIGTAEMPPKEKRTDFVLSPFDAEEESQVNDMVSRAGEVCMEFAAFGVAHAMNRCTG